MRESSLVVQLHLGDSVPHVEIATLPATQERGAFWVLHIGDVGEARVSFFGHSREQLLEIADAIAAQAVQASEEWDEVCQ